MPPDSNSNPQGQIKTTRNNNKMVNMTNSINTYLLAFLLSVPIKVIKLIKIIYRNVLLGWNIYRCNMCKNNSTTAERGNRAV